MMNLKERIQAGVEGKFQGLNNGFNRLNDYIFGIQKGTYILLGGSSGCGKTTLVNFMLLNAIQDAEAKGIPLTVFYYSFEIDELTMKCNWLSNIIYNKYNIIIPPEKIKGFGKNRLTPDELLLVESEIDYIDSLFKKINFVFRPLNPTGIYKQLFTYASSVGTFETYDYVDEHGKDKKGLKSYVPNDPREVKLVIMDHMLLLLKERGFEAKEVIDKYSEYCVTLRNMCGYSFINLQQFNSGLSAVDRLKFRGIDLAPQQNDFRDSTSPFNDCDIAMGLMNPYKLGLEQNLGYNVERLGESFIHLKVIKNRLSKDNIAVGLHFNPKAGMFKELPPANQINYNEYTQ